MNSSRLFASPKSIESKNISLELQLRLLILHGLTLTWTRLMIL